MDGKDSMRIAKVGLLAVVALAATGCGGDKDKGPAGDAGAQGAAGTPGTPGAAGAPGTPGAPGAGALTPAGDIVYDVLSANVAEGKAPTVTFRVLDHLGQPFDLKAEMPAQLRPTFLLGRLGANGKFTSYLTRTTTGQSFGTPPQAPALTSAVQAASEAVCASATNCSAGNARMVATGAPGVYTYTFASPVTGVAASETHRVAVYGTRTFQGQSFPGANTFDFRPDGGAVAVREVVTDAACNKCHTVVNAHGGSRRGVKLCLVCHSPQTKDPETGNSVDMALMIHKIHKGKLLANGYTIVGNGQSIHAFGDHVQMGPSHSTYFELTQPAVGPATPPIEDRGLIRECALCHQGATADRHQTAISRDTCTHCHDTINFDTGAGHLIGGIPFPVADDAVCQFCHGQALGFLPVAKVHSINYEPSRNLEFSATHTFALKIDKVNNAISGGATAPDIEFTVTLDGAPYDVFSQVVPTATVTGRSLGALGFQITGPIDDYKENLPTNSSVLSGLGTGVANPARVTVIDAATGKYRFTFAAPIAAGKTGVYVAAFEAYFREQKLGPAGEIISKPYAADPVFRGATKNLVYVNIATGAAQAATVARRNIVANAKCGNCHEDIGFHSNRSRQGVDYCATCHNTQLSNAGRARFQLADTAVPSGALAAALPGVTARVFVAESVATEVFIHKIHRGVENTKPYRLGANRTATDPTPGPEGLSDFSQFESPSPMGNCQTCHDGETFGLPEFANQLAVRQAVLPCPQQDANGWCQDTNAAGAVIRPVAIATLVTPPMKGVCTSCHDTDAAKAHADLNTLSPNSDSAIETCAACHGRGRDFDALKMHPPVLVPSIDLP
jgi:OmcA/MtrC family decaheme c-type cytochrome